MLTHFAAYVQGSWHVVYERPGRIELVPVLDCGEQAIAEREAERMNDEQRAKQTAPARCGQCGQDVDAVRRRKWCHHICCQIIL